MVDSPWLPGLSSREDIRSRCNLGCWIAFDICPSLGIPCGQLFEGIGIYLKAVFLASVKDNVAIELGLKDVILVEGSGTELAEGRPGNFLARLGYVHQDQRRSVAVVEAEEVLEKLAGFVPTWQQ
jgi:hypothetical protein